MRIVTSRRLRAVGILLLEAAGLAVLIAERVGSDPKLKSTFVGFVNKVRAL
jgi:hypothetical protein